LRGEVNIRFEAPISIQALKASLQRTLLVHALGWPL
jgi:hypothetical protein